MVAFELSINGQKIATAGVGEMGILLAIVRWVRRPASGCTFQAETFADVELCGQCPPENRHVVWADRPLKVRDEVLVRVVEVEKPDEPQSTTPISDLPVPGEDQRGP